jgi:hypothetical protein
MRSWSRYARKHLLKTIQEIIVTIGNKKNKQENERFKNPYAKARRFSARHHQLPNLVREFTLRLSP